eukprot:scaffold8851_cov115-Isochrysis_galbana.AAC.2
MAVCWRGTTYCRPTVAAAPSTSSPDFCPAFKARLRRPSEQIRPVAECAGAPYAGGRQWSARLRDLVLGVLPQLPVHDVDLVLVALEQLRALELEGRGEAVVLDGEALAKVVDVGLDKGGLRDLKPVELGGLSIRLELVKEEGGHLGLGKHVGQLGARRGPACLNGVRHHLVLVGRDNRHQLCGVRVAEVLDLLGGDVLALSQLEDVLLPVDDGQRAVRVPPANVARVQPSVLTEHLGRRVGVLVVSDKVDGALGEDLATGGHAIRRVIHLGHVHQLDVLRRHRRPHAAGAVLTRQRQRGVRAVLGHAVALEHLGAHGGDEELVHVGGERRGAREDHAHLAAQRLAHRPEEEAQARAAPPILGRTILELHRIPKESSDDGGLRLDGAHHLVVHALEDTGHADEEGRLERRHVLQNQLDVARIEANAPAAAQDGVLDHRLENVSEGQVGQVGLLPEIDATAPRGADGDAAVRQAHALRVACGPGCVHDDGDGIGLRDGRRRQRLVALEQHCVEVGHGDAGANERVGVSIRSLQLLHLDDDL